MDHTLIVASTGLVRKSAAARTGAAEDAFYREFGRDHLLPLKTGFARVRRALGWLQTRHASAEPQNA